MSQATYQEMTEDQKMFAVRAGVQDFYNNLVEAISGGQGNYPTGDQAFDDYVQPIVNEMTTFKNKLENDYGEFIDWTQP